MKKTGQDKFLATSLTPTSLLALASDGLGVPTCSNLLGDSDSGSGCRGSLVHCQLSSNEKNVSNIFTIPDFSSIACNSCDLDIPLHFIILLLVDVHAHQLYIYNNLTIIYYTIYVYTKKYVYLLYILHCIAYIFGITTYITKFHELLGFWDF